MPSDTLYSGLQRVKFNDPVVAAGMDTLQGQIDQQFKRMCSQPILDGVLIEDIPTTATSDADIVIAHRLGRRPRGFILTDSNAAVTLYRSPTAVRNESLQIILRAVFPVAAVHKFSCWFF